MEHKGDDAEDLELLPFLREDGVKVRIGGEQGRAWSLLECLDGELAIQAGHYDGTVAGLDRPIDYQQVTIIDASLHHAVTAGPDIEGGGRVLDAKLVQIDGLLDVVLRGRGEAACHWGEEQGELDERGIDVMANHDKYHCMKIQ